MIDTIIAEIETKELGNLAQLIPTSTNTTYGYNYHSYKIRNFRINIREIKPNEYKLTMIGSLSKFLHGSNLVRFTRVDAKRAILELSQQIGMDIKDARIKRLDLAANMLLKFPSECYTILLAHKSWYKRGIVKDSQTVTFGIASTELSFYNKKKQFLYEHRRDTEYKRRFASLLRHKYWIRYELKLKKSLGSFNNSSILRLSDIYKTSVYKKLVLKWHSHYDSIVKDVLVDFPKFSSFNGFLISEGIKAIGGLSSTYECLDAWLQFHGYEKDKKKNKKIQEKKKLERILKEVEVHDLIKELNEKIEFEREFYL